MENEKEQQMFKCPFCEKEYKLPQNMVQHLQRTHGYTNEQLQDLYDKMYLNGVRPKCKFYNCDKAPTFISFIRGYRDCCGQGHATAYKTFLKYGTWSTLHTPGVEEKVDKIFKDKFKGGHPGKDPEVHKKIKATLMKNLGVDNPLKSKEIQNKIRKTMIERYNVPTCRTNPDSIKKANITNRKKGGDKKYQSFLKFLELRNFIPLFTEEEYYKFEPLKHKCKICGSEYSVMVPSNVRACCITHDRLTNIEEPIKQILDACGISYNYRDRKHLGRKEIDFFIPKNNLGIECNGLYFHSEEYMFKKFETERPNLSEYDKEKLVKFYHVDKTNECLSKGITLLQIWENEILFKCQIIESMIKGRLGLFEKKYRASDLKFMPIDKKVGNAFMEENHLQGKAGNGSDYYGLVDKDNNLISCVLFGSKRTIFRKDKDKDYSHIAELVRYATKVNCQVHGGFTKLLQGSMPYLKENDKTVIETFCDRRFSPDANNTVYAKNGFALIEKTEPDYWYYTPEGMKHRYAYARHTLLERYSDQVPNIETLSEKQITKQLGFFSLWDCGQFKFKLDI